MFLGVIIFEDLEKSVCELAGNKFQRGPFLLADMVQKMDVVAGALKFCFVGDMVQQIAIARTPQKNILVLFGICGGLENEKVCDYLQEFRSFHGLLLWA